MLLAASAAAIVTSVPAHAQSCQSQWLTGGQQEGIRGLNSTVNAAAQYDPDGAGPLPAILVVGGSFTEAGSIDTRALAAWNGSQWSSLGDVLSNTSTGTVDAIWVHNGELIIAGRFSSVAGVNARNIAAFNGTTWRALDNGIGTSSFGQVFSLTTYNGQLYAGGQFTVASTAVATNIARWDGSSWHPVGPGKVRGDGGSAFVRTLTVFNNELIAGGNFQFAGEVQSEAIARWNGTVWQPLGAGLTSGSSTGDVSSLAVFNGALLAGGSFNTAGSTPVSGLARWNGTSWNNPTPSTSYSFVRSMHVAQGFLYFEPNNFSQAARWNGSSTQAEFFGGSFSGTANAITSFGPEVVFGGSISNLGTSPSNIQVQNIGAWDGTRWLAYGRGFSQSSSIQALLQDGTGMYMAGSFSAAGNIQTDNIVRWNGNTGWTRLGDGLSSTVQDLAFLNGQLVASGGFGSSGNTTTGQVARWTGTQWLPIAPNNTVNSANKMHVDGTTLYIAGVSSVSGPGGFNSQPNGSVVATYNGSTWARLGTGFNSTVNDVIVWNGQPIATGSFTSVSGQSGRNHIARWDGTAWQPLGTGLNSTGQCLAIFNGDLIVGGNFSQAGGTNVQNIARWNGSTWQSVGSGISSSVLDLNVIQGELYAVGSFSTAGGTTANNIARWNGVTWSSFDSGLNTTTQTIEPMADGRVIVGGNFTTAGGLNSYRWAQLAPGGSAFQIVNQPADLAACPGSTAQFVVDVTSSSGVTYQWRRNGEPLRNGRGIAGVNSSALAIDNVTTDDNALYDCIITSVCGRSATRAASLSVENLPECPILCDDIDFNNDGGFFDPCDIESFLLVFAEGPCTNCGQ